MKKTSSILTATWVMFLIGLMNISLAQDLQINYFRAPDQRGINVFEPAKTDQGDYDGVKVRIGGNFTQQFQMLSHETMGRTTDTEGNTMPIELYNLGAGFNTATANLNLAFQIEDGIFIYLENYMSSRHHSEFWVKGGYIQIDKLPMFGSPDWFTDMVRVKIGHFQPNYGDQQFRRTDNGNAIWNPFVGNYIVDGFTTEIGGEVYIFPADGLMLMGGLTAGYINGNVAAAPKATGSEEQQKRNPTVYLKAAYDKQVNDDVRIRLSASLTANGNQNRSTLYAGDRTGSRYYNALEVPGSSAFTSGRWNPNFRNKLVAFQVNPFVKIAGLEFFGTYENARGNARFQSGADKEDRKMTQLSGELIYRFLANEQLFIGGRYNQVNGNLLTASMDEQTINRLALSAGWFPTRNLLLKIEGVSQNYKDFPTDMKEYEGKFDGVVIEAVVGF
jgi:hypothetical protein